MNRIHESVAVERPNYSAFDLSRELKGSYKFGNLYPIFLEEILPGDQFSVNSEVMIRLAPMVAPVMHRIDAYIHYFYVPNRLIWTNWEDFITGGDDGTATPAIPVRSLSTVARLGKGSLSDYFGLPTIDAPATVPLDVMELPYRAYHLIWNEYYRDQDLQDEYDFETQGGNDTFYQVRARAWMKDYFTSARPNPQKGPAVPIPIDGSFSPQYEQISNFLDSAGSPFPDGSTVTNLGDEIGIDTGGPFGPGRIENLVDPQIVANVSFTVEELRRASRLQQWLELAQRAGSRYKEFLMSYFGVRSSDSRLDRPEYLGGGKQPVVISEVLNTTGVIDSGGTPISEPQGTMAGHGITVGDLNNFRYTFEEHGFVIGLLSVMPQPSYQQGVHRLWSRRDKFDYYFHQFANIGEQEVLGREIYFDFDDNADNDSTFGYQQRYAEYKYSCSSVHGDFRSNLSYWTMTRIFQNRPLLNETFIQCDDTTLDDIFAIQDGTDYLWVQMYHSVKARRKMPYFSRPELG